MSATTSASPSSASVPAASVTRPVGQFLRFWSLIAADDSGSGIELKDLEVKFVIHHGTYTFPHSADIRIYNLTSRTQVRLATEFTKIQLQAGYIGNYGTIFQGAIKQVRIGREGGVDGFTDIFAADGDTLHNFGVVNTSLPAGYSQQQVWNTIGAAAKPHNDTAPLIQPPATGGSPRGKVMYGMLRDYIRDWGDTNQQLVTVDNGILTAMPYLAYKQGDAVVINELTGMVGSPELTEQGVTVTCLLNPAIMWGTRIQLNNSEITRNLVGVNEGKARQGTGPFAAFTVPIIPDLQADGFYKALSVDHIGETRGNPWYTQIICVALDPTGSAYARTPGTTSLNLGDPPAP